MKRRRKDLLELVGMKVEDSGAKQVADQVIALEQRAWYHMTKAQARKSDSLSKSLRTKQAECEEYFKTNFLALKLAYDLYPVNDLYLDLEKIAVNSRKAGDISRNASQEQADNVAGDSYNAFHWQDKLELYQNLVRTVEAIADSEEVSKPLSWCMREEQDTKHLSNNVQGSHSVAVLNKGDCSVCMCELKLDSKSGNRLDQPLAFQVRVEVPSETASFLAVGVFPEEVFTEWQRGQWNLDMNKAERDGRESPILKVDRARIIGIHNTAGSLIADADAHNVPWIELDENSTVGIAVDFQNKCISFSVSTWLGTAEFGDCLAGESKCYPAAVYVTGNSSATVHIVSAPVLSLHAALKARALLAKGKSEKTSKSEPGKQSGADSGEEGQGKKGGEPGGNDTKGGQDEKKKEEDSEKTGEEGQGKKGGEPGGNDTKGGQGEKKKEEDSGKTLLEKCKKSLEHICDAHADRDATYGRLLNYKQQRANSTAQADILRFFDEITQRRCCAVQLLTCQETGPHIDFKTKACFSEILRCEVQVIEAIASSLLDVVLKVLVMAGGDWRNSKNAFGPSLELLEQTDVLVRDLSSVLNVFESISETFQQLIFDVDSLDDSKQSIRFSDLPGAYSRGGIAAKQLQGQARATACQEFFRRLESAPRQDIPPNLLCLEDLRWMCNPGVSSELWLTSLDLYEHDHAERVGSWFERQCVGSELMRMVSNLDDFTLQQPSCQRRFLSILNTFEAACMVLPLTSENAVVSDQRRFERVDKLVKQKKEQIRSESERQNVENRLNAGQDRIRKRWDIISEQDQDSKRLEQQKHMDTSKAHVATLSPEATSRSELRRAETRYWDAMTLLYARELSHINAILHAQPGGNSAELEHAKYRRRSVKRCLELLDDTIYQTSLAATADESGRIYRKAEVTIADLHLDDAIDAWEARLMGMLALRQPCLKLSCECVVAYVSGETQLCCDLPIGDIASWDRKELSLSEPQLSEHIVKLFRSKLSAFLACFISRSSPNKVRVYLRNANGTKPIMDSPIILVPGGGLDAHISANEDGAKVLDFSSSGLNTFGLRLLIEAARADEDIVHGTIAGANDLDLSGQECADEINGRVPFKRKAVIEDMRLQCNQFGAKNSPESMEIICNLIAISAFHLTTLNLSHNKINSAGAKVLSIFMEKGGAPLLKYLDLSDNELQDEGIQYLCNFVGKLPASNHRHLEHLRLGSNSIQWTGALYLADAMSSSSCCITELNLARNRIGDQGLVALSASLSTNESLTSLDVSENSIGDVGVDAFTQRWGTSEKASLHLLKSLDLSRNGITVLGADRLFGADFDRLAPNLTFLSLSSNRISHKGIKNIATRLSTCKKLQSLCLETQLPLHQDSNVTGDSDKDLYHYHLFVKGVLSSSDDNCINEAQAKGAVLSDINPVETSKASTIANTQLLDYLQKYSCNAGTLTDAERNRIAGKDEEALEERKTLAQKEWDGSKLERSKAIGKLKEEWLRNDKAQSHLNRQDLFWKTQKALEGLTSCFESMRSNEPQYYLIDVNYTKALKESLDARRDCVEGFRKNLFSSLLKSLRPTPEEEIAAEDTDSTSSSVQNVWAELKVRALRNLVHAERLVQQEKTYRNSIEGARLRNRSAFVTPRVVAEIFKENQHTREWLTRARVQEEDVDSELAHRILDSIVRKNWRWESLPVLGKEGGQTLQAVDESRKNAALEKEQKADGDRPFTKAIEIVQEALDTRHKQDTVMTEKQTVNATEGDILALGSKWKNHGTTEPADGRELVHSELAAALERGQNTFTEEELRQLDVLDLHHDHFVRVGDSYFTPVVLELPVEKLDGEHKTILMDWLLSLNLSCVEKPAARSSVQCGSCSESISSWPFTPGGPWSCDCDRHKDDKMITGSTVAYGCATPRNCSWWMCEACYKAGTVGVLVIYKKPETEEHPRKFFTTEQEVTQFFDSNPDCRDGWIHSTELTSLWDITTGEGVLAETYPQGSQLYWQEVGNLVSSVSCRYLREICRVQKDQERQQADVFAARWGGAVEDFAVTPPSQQISKIISRLTDYQNEHATQVNNAYEICSSLNSMFDQDVSNPYGLVRDGFENIIGGVRGNVARFLEAERMLKKLVGVMEEFDQQVGTVDESVTKEKLEAIVKEMRIYCSEKLPGFFRDPDIVCRKQAGSPSPLYQPVRLARQRVDAVRQDVENVFVFNGGRFQRDLESLLRETAEHAQSTKTLESMCKRLSFDAHISGFKPLSLDLAKKVNAPIVNKTVSFVQCWHLNPEETSRSYSSVKRGNLPLKSQAHPSSCLDSPQAWSPATNKDGEWLEIDLGEVKSIAGIVTQGCAQGALEHQYVTKVFVQHRRQSEVEYMLNDTEMSRQEHEDAAIAWGGHLETMRSEDRPPKCPTEGHEMVFAVGSYVSYICNECRGSFDGERWYCASCRDDYCADCGPKPVSVGVYKKTHPEHTDQKWVTTRAAHGEHFECMGGDSKTEHHFAASVEARYVRIFVKEWHCSIAMRAGVLEKARQEFQGTIILNHHPDHKGKCLVALTGAEISKVALDSALQENVDDVVRLWVDVDDLVDLDCDELGSSLQTRMGNELAGLKQALRESSESFTLSLSKQAQERHARSVTCVREELKQTMTVWNDSKVQAGGLTCSPHCLCWLRVAFDNAKYFQKFWNLDLEHPIVFGQKCKSHAEWEGLREFVKDAENLIKKSTQAQAQAQDAPGHRMNVRWELVEEDAPQDLMLQWEHAGWIASDSSSAIFHSPDQHNLTLNVNTNMLIYLPDTRNDRDTPDCCTVLSAPVANGRHHFSFIMHKIGGDRCCGVTADKTLAGSKSNLRAASKCWTYYSGEDGCMLLIEGRADTKQLARIKDGDVIGVTVDFDHRSLAFSRNGVLQIECGIPEDVSALYLVTVQAPGDRVELQPWKRRQLRDFDSGSYATRLRVVFEILDRDGDGMLAIHECKPLLMAINEVNGEDIEEMNEEQIQANLLDLFNGINEDSPGDISEARFLAFFQKEFGGILEKDSGDDEDDEDDDEDDDDSTCSAAFLPKLFASKSLLDLKVLDGIELKYRLCSPMCITIITSAWRICARALVFGACALADTAAGGTSVLT